MKEKMEKFYVLFFGAVGVLARYFITLFIGKDHAVIFPYSTFFINLAGAFAIGVVFSLSLKSDFISDAMRVGIMVGFLGGFTTFSSYCFETLWLFEVGYLYRAIFYAVMTPVLGIAAVFLGVYLGSRF